MAKVKTNFKKLAASFSVPVVGPGSLTDIGQFIVKRIQGFTRLGYSLSGNPETPKSNQLLALSPGYIKWRKNLKKGQTSRLDLTGEGLDQSFVPGRSQLTLTGQLLNSLQYRVNPTSKTVNIFVASTTRDDGETNINVAKNVILHGRPFMGIDKIGLQTISNRWVKSILRRGS